MYKQVCTICIIICRVLPKFCAWKHLNSNFSFIQAAFKFVLSMFSWQTTCHEWARMKSYLPGRIICLTWMTRWHIFLALKLCQQQALLLCIVNYLAPTSYWSSFILTNGNSFLAFTVIYFCYPACYYKPFWQGCLICHVSVLRFPITPGVSNVLAPLCALIACSFLLVTIKKLKVSVI